MSRVLQRLKSLTVSRAGSCEESPGAPPETRHSEASPPILRSPRSARTAFVVLITLLGLGWGVALGYWKARTLSFSASLPLSSSPLFSSASGAAPSATPLTEEIRGDNRRALDAYYAGDLEGARELFELVLSKAPANPQVLANAAVVLARSGQLSRARKMFHEVLARDPTNAVALHGLGRLEFAAGDLKQAGELLERAASDRAHAHAWLSLGELAERQARWQDASDFYLRYLHDAPGERWLGGLLTKRVSWLASVASAQSNASLHAPLARRRIASDDPSTGTGQSMGAAKQEGGQARHGNVIIQGGD